MSEKIYACLLRLYPPAFRRRYEEETIQLLHDRIRDEPGYLSRLRLGFDLIFDILHSLPQAYRNSYSYSEAATLNSVTHTLDGVPSFQSLHNEPICRGTFVFAGTLTLTLLIAFGYVMELPIPSPAAQSNRPKSPVESVLERLNRQIPQGSEEEFSSRAPHAAPTAVSPPKERATSTVISSQANVLIAPPEGLSGKWIEYPAASGDSQFPCWLILVQHDTVLRGFGALDSSHQYPMIRGSVVGNSVELELSDEQKNLIYDLRLEGEELRGTLTIIGGNETRRASVRLRRAR